MAKRNPVPQEALNKGEGGMKYDDDHEYDENGKMKKGGGYRKAGGKMHKMGGHGGTHSDGPVVLHLVGNHQQAGYGQPHDGKSQRTQRRLPPKSGAGRPATHQGGHGVAQGQKKQGRDGHRLVEQEKAGQGGQRNISGSCDGKSLGGLENRR